ncbi:MAG: Rieske 2Fe-2S domain-containing protein, partial [Planctomycetota bacterium]
MTDFSVDEDIRLARTLPASAFTDPAFLTRELGSLFTRSWVLIPDTPPAEPASHVPVTVLGRPLLLRREQGGLRLFPNVCTHAWHTLAQAPGKSRTILCPQHGRTFDGAGRCVAQKGFSPETVPDFPGEQDHLRIRDVEDRPQRD